MKITEMKSIQFPKATYDDWKVEAVNSLKGKSFDHLTTPTFEGIQLQPLYTEDHVNKTLNYSEIISFGIQDSKWMIAQPTFSTTAQEFLHKTEDQLNRGNEMIVYMASSPAYKWTSEELNHLKELIKNHPFYFSIEDEKDSILGVFSLLSNDELKEVSGYVNGRVSVPNMNTLVSTSPIHYAGGTAIHELTHALLTFAKIAEKNQDFSNSLAVQFSVDTNFFMEIAKLRAFRVLWKAFISAYGIQGTTIPLFVETSLRSYSKLDDTVNLLRAGNAAFSAVLGGADALIVYPHDILTGSSLTSERMARNIQLVIREETMVSKFIDPSSGSYYIESLTEDLVRESWKLFIHIQSMDEDSQENYLMDLIKEVSSNRHTAFATRKASLIGTNIYANPSDIVNPTIMKANIERLAIAFENFRDQFQKNGLKSAVVSFGILKEVKPRADFVQGFLQAGGLNPLMSPVFEKIEDAWHWVKKNDIAYVVIAAKDDLTKEIIPSLLEQKFQHIFMDVAGKYPEETLWKESGLNGSIYAGQDLIAKMEQLVQLKKAGGHTDET
ncbi:MAG: methylmalonyl-CoA mutase family protein [Paenisporosarcina sp.]